MAQDEMYATLVRREGAVRHVTRLDMAQYEALVVDFAASDHRVLVDGTVEPARVYRGVAGNDDLQPKTFALLVELVTLQSWVGGEPLARALDVQSQDPFGALKKQEGKLRRALEGGDGVSRRMIKRAGRREETKWIVRPEAGLELVVIVPDHLLKKSRLDAMMATQAEGGPDESERAPSLDGRLSHAECADEDWAAFELVASNPNALAIDVDSVGLVVREGPGRPQRRLSVPLPPVQSGGAWHGRLLDHVAGGGFKLCRVRSGDEVTMPLAQAWSRLSPDGAPIEVAAQLACGDQVVLTPFLRIQANDMKEVSE